MPDKPNNQNHPSGNADEIQQIYSLLGRLLYDFFNSPKILNLLKAQPIVGNFIVASLVTFTGFSIFENLHPKTINTYSMCEQIKREVASQLNIDSSEIIDFSAGTIPSNIENPLFDCTYDIQEKSEGKSENTQIYTEKYYITFQVLRKEFVASIKEAKITKEVLKDICKDESIYTRELVAQEQYDPDKHNIIEEGLVLQEDSENSVYPVFRWKCKYQVIPKNYQEPNKPTSQFPSIYIGLDLDVYCEKEYKEENLTKARYHYYNDPDSLYCVNPNF